MNKSILKKLRALLAILVVAGGVQTFTSCSSGDGDGDNPSSSSVGTQATGSSSSGVRSGSSSSAVQCLDADSGTFTDIRDNKKYKYVTMCSAITRYSQIWMAENLNYEVEGSKCYDNLQSNCDIYGRLYDWATAMGFDASCNESPCADQENTPSQGICPDGWHIPNSAEWDALFTAYSYYSSIHVAGTILKATSGWNKDGNGRDNYGFRALPGGCGYSNGTFEYVGDRGIWHRRVQGDMSQGISYLMYDSRGSGLENSRRGDRLFSVRCLKDGDENLFPSSSSLAENYSSSAGYSGSYGSVSYNGKIYKTVIIGTQIWMAENLNYEVEGSKCYDNLQSNCDIYGRLYDWATAMGFDASCNENRCAYQIQTKHRGICPSGWHIPRYAEWEELETTVKIGGGVGTILKATSGWQKDVFKYTSEGSCDNGTDDYGFSALPSGYRYSNGSFRNVGYDGYWWTPIEYRDYVSYSHMSHSSCSLLSEFADKTWLLSVRCVKD